MIKQETKEEEGCVDFDIAEPRSAEASWRRLALRVFLVTEAARQQVVLNEVIVLAPSKTRLATEAAAAASGKQVTYVTREEVISRPLLTDSKSLKQVCDPDTCPHPGLWPRGSRKAMWYTCHLCPRRWQRYENEQLIPE